MTTTEFQTSCADVGYCCGWHGTGDSRVGAVAALAEHLDTTHRLPAANSATIRAHLEAVVAPASGPRPSAARSQVRRYLGPLRRTMGRLRPAIRPTPPAA